MKIAIVGTSNCIRKEGWVRHFISNNPSFTVDNFSAGAVTSLYASYIIDKKDITTNYDYCILDFCINDQVALDLNKTNIKFLASSILSMLSKFLTDSATCISVVLILTPKGYVYTLDNHIIRKLVITLCAKFNIRIVDIAQFVTDCAVKDAIPIEEIYFESNHYSNDYCKIIADLASKAFTTQAFSLRKIPSDMNIYAIPDDEIEWINCEKSSFSTSLATHETWVLRDQSYINIENTPFLCGIFCYTHELSGYVYVNSFQTIIRKNLADKFTKMFFLKHFINPVFSESNRFQLGLNAPGVCSDDQGWFFEVPVEHNQSDSIIGICGFIGVAQDPVRFGEKLLLELNFSL